MPQKSNLVIAQAAARPKAVLTGTAISAVSDRQPDGVARVWMLERRRKDADARRERLGEDDKQRRQDKKCPDDEHRGYQRAADGRRVADAWRLPATDRAHRDLSV